MIRATLTTIGLLALSVTSLGMVVIAAVDRLPAQSLGHPLRGHSSIPVAGDARVGQQFTAPLPGLYRIQITPARAAIAGAGPITFHLQTNPAAADDLWTAQLDPAHVQEGLPYDIEFPQLRDSRGQTYYFYVESASSTPDNAIALYYDPLSSLDGASAYLNGQPTAGNLQFNTFYTPSMPDQIETLLDRLAQGRPAWFGNRAFYAGLALAYILVLGILVLQIAQAALGKQKGE